MEPPSKAKPRRPNFFGGKRVQASATIPGVRRHALQKVHTNRLARFCNEFPFFVTSLYEGVLIYIISQGWGRYHSIIISTSEQFHHGIIMLYHTEHKKDHNTKTNIITRTAKEKGDSRKTPPLQPRYIQSLLH
jgi:hypothetical protein